MIFDSISSNIDDVLSIYLSANVFVFGDFNVHHKDWLTYSGGTDRPGELCYNFSISDDLIQIVNFPTSIPDCDSHGPALLNLFLPSGTSICSTMAFPTLENSDHVVVSNSKQDATFHCVAYDYSCADWDGLCDHLRDVPQQDIFKLSASAAACEFCGCVQVVIDVYIPHRKHQVKPHSSPWFLAACAAAIIHRNLYQQYKSSESKVKFRQANNHCKRVLEAPKLAYGAKTKESITSQKLGSWVFWQIANSVLNKGKSAEEFCFPDCWKVSSVVPVFKNVGERSTAKNYHPVSLFSVVSKVFEKLVNNRIVDHLENCVFFSDFQYGFRSSQSTADLLTVV